MLFHYFIFAKKKNRFLNANLYGAQTAHARKFYYVVDSYEDQHRYDVERLDTQFHDSIASSVIVVPSIDRYHPKNQNEILVEPESNPYYDHENVITGRPSNVYKLNSGVEKITSVNNIYYE